MLLRVVLKNILPYIIGGAMILGVGWWIFHSGYTSGVDDTVQKYEVKIQEERQRQQSANEDALKLAKESEANLRRLLSERNATIRILMQEAFTDPNATRPAVGADSVLRIDRIH